MNCRIRYFLPNAPMIAANLRMTEQQFSLHPCAGRLGCMREVVQVWGIFTYVNVAGGYFVVAIEIGLVSSKHKEIVGNLVETGAVVIVHTTSIGSVVSDHEVFRYDVVFWDERRRPVQNICQIRLQVVPDHAT